MKRFFRVTVAAAAAVVALGVVGDNMGFALKMAGLARSGTPTVELGGASHARDDAYWGKDSFGTQG